VSGSIAGRHRATVDPRPRLARAWTAVSVLCATLAIGAVLPVVLPSDPNWSPFGTALRTAPAVRAAQPTADPMPAAEPVSLSIAALGANSDVVPLGLRDDGAMEVPDGARETGWYEQSPTPGELGPAVLAAHVDWADEPGVFHDLDRLETGDEIAVLRDDDTVATFVVERVATYAKSGFPTDEVYGDIDHPGLRLITCGGEFDEDTGDYADNVVVFARLVG
jgi:Sortase domain